MLPKFINLRITWSTLVSENYIINIASIMIYNLRLVHQKPLYYSKHSIFEH